MSRNRFAKLLHRPLSGGMRRDIDMNQSATRMLNPDKHVKQTKGRSDRHTEITGHDVFGMIAENVEQR